MWEDIADINQTSIKALTAKRVEANRVCGNGAATRDEDENDLAENTASPGCSAFPLNDDAL